MCRVTCWPRRAAHSLTQRRAAGQHVERGIERPLWIVLMSDRRPEDGEHGIADEFRHKAVIAG